jgi:hypothetical protein
MRLKNLLQNYKKKSIISPLVLLAPPSRQGIIMQTANFFDISLNTINLFSIIIGMAFVPMSSIWGGRRQATVIVIVYLAGLAFYYGAIKPMRLPNASPSASVPVAQSTYPEASVPPISDVVGKHRK